MALAAIPASVLTKLRKLIFNFLWSGCSDHHRQHLCNWQTLAKPKQKGGWGIQNLFHFSQALAANSLWRALNILAFGILLYLINISATTQSAVG
jgi:hypothetical protein